MKLSSILLVGIFVTTAVRIFLLFFQPLYLEARPIELLYYAQSVFSINPETASLFTKFGQNQGYLLLFVPLIFYKTISLFINGILAFKIAQAVILCLSVLIFFKISNLISTKYNMPQLFTPAALYFFLLSPWSLFVLTYDLPASLTLLFFMLSVYLIFMETKPIYLFLALLLLSFSSWPGLITGIFIAFFTYYKHIISSRQILALSIILILMLILNRNYIFNTFSNSFLKQLTPSALGTQINNRQRIDYLAVNQQFLLPGLLRKYIYNKPTYFANEIISKTISYIDFDQWASVLDSYALVSKSGLPPKGNWQIFYGWQIPLLLFGIYAITKRGVKLPLIVFLPIVSGILTYLLFEKRDIVTTQILALPVSIYMSVLGVIIILKKAVWKKKVIKLAGVTILIILTTSSVVQTYLLFYPKISEHRYTHSYFYDRIAYSIKKYKNQYNSIIATDRLGPTFLTTAFYLQYPPRLFWHQYFSGDQKIDNVSFTSFQLQ
ncbi:MAG: hypothetical protein AABY10_04170, partial [Nanoarchaeota archaeon]